MSTPDPGTRGPFLIRFPHPLPETVSWPRCPPLEDVTTTGFKIRMNELVVSDPDRHAISDGGHTTETIGWVAFSA